MNRAPIPLCALAAAMPCVARAQFLEPGVVVLHTIQGEAAGDQMGWAVAGLRDIDGDGVQELICPAPGNSANTGRVYVRSGRTGLPIPGMTFSGSVAGARLGAAVADAGDVNDDDEWDVVCGAPGPGNTAGRISIFSGAGGALIRTVGGQVAGDGFGYSVAGIGDVNGDGHGEVVVGAPGHDTMGNGAGRAYVVSGIDGSFLRFHDGVDAGDRFGSGAATAGDLTGDGVEEYIIGANLAGAAPVGRAYVYNGATGAPHVAPLAPTVVGATFGDFFVAGLADVDGDLKRDLYVGDYGASRAYVYSGADGHLIHAISAPGGIGPGRGAGDLDRDGREDLAIGAWQDSQGAPQGGSVTFYSGLDASPIRKVTSTLAGANLGFDAVGIGDVNSDGQFDCLIGAGGPGGNVIYVVAGKPLCYPDCNHDGTLNLADFGCFQTLFALSRPYTDCNGDLFFNLADFGCFQTRFALGCP